MADYIPSPVKWVREHVEKYEGSGGTEGAEMMGMPVILVTHTGGKSGAVRKTPLMRAEVDGKYILVGSLGGAPKNPVWVYNLRANGAVEIRDKTEVFQMQAREVTGDEERARLWKIAAQAFPTYDEYQGKTTRKIPIFLAE